MGTRAGRKDFLYMRPEAEIDQRIIANALWIALAPPSSSITFFREGINCLTGRRDGRMATMKGPHRLPDFSVVVWIKKNENFGAVRSEVLAAAGAEPYETRRSWN